METSSAHYPHINSSPRAVAMVLALVTAIVLSPLYVDHRKSESRLEGRWSSSGFVLPAVVAGLIVAIKTTTSSSSKNAMQKRVDDFQYSENNDASFMFRIGSSTWGLAGILILLLCVISWQASVQQFFWR